MKSLKHLLVLLALAVAAAPLNAQDQTNPAKPPAEGRRGKGGQRGPGPQGQGRGQMMNPAARVEQLDRTLGLTDDQKTKLTDIFAKARDEMQAARGSGDPQANREQMRQAMQATRDQVQGVLTDEQRKKFEEMERPGRGEPRGDFPKGGPRGGQGKRKKDV